MNLLNFTPHDINILLKDGSVLTIPSQGIVRALQDPPQEVGSITINDNKIPITKITFGEPTGIPTIQKDDLIIVSQIAAQAIKTHNPQLISQVLIPGPLNKETGNIEILCKI